MNGTDIIFIYDITVINRIKYWQMKYNMSLLLIYEIFFHSFSASLVLASLGNLSRLEVDEIKQGGSGQWLNLSDDQRWRKTQFLGCKCFKYQKVRFKRSKGSIYNIFIERSQRPKHSWAAPWLLQNQFRKWEWPTVATIPGPSQRLSGKKAERRQLSDNKPAFSWADTEQWVLAL